MGSTCCNGRSDKQFLSTASPPAKMSVKRARPSAALRKCITAPLHAGGGSRPALEPIIEEEEAHYASSQQGPKAIVEYA